MPAPDGGYGWVVVAASFIANYLAGSLYLAYSMLMVEFSEVFGHSKAITAGALSVQSGFFYFSGKPLH